MPGKGATASIGGRLIWLGSHLLLEARGQETPEMHQRLEELERDGSSVIVLGKNEHVCGFLALSDEVRQEALPAIEQLRQAGIEHIVMLTGDNRGTAESVGRALAVDEVRAELLPEDKVTAIEDLVRRYERVAMVGDGVNDAPAMARAGLAIAMGAAGTDAALETADIALMGDDLRHIPWLMRHSRRTVADHPAKHLRCSRRQGRSSSRSRSPATPRFGLRSPPTPGMSLLVVFNALRLLRPGR